MKITTLFFISAFILSASFAQQKSFVPGSELIFDESNLKAQANNNTQSLNKILTNWVLVDTMQNSFSPALPFLTPIAYDQSSNALILVHRGSTSYAQSSGEIWYNLLTDHGISWERVSAINNNLDLSGRYPNAVISNPNDGGISQSKGIFTWSHLNNPVFYGSGYGKDEPLGTGTPIANYDSVNSAEVLWTCGEWSFWAGGTPDVFKVARTNDFSNIEHYQVLDVGVSVISLGGVGYNGIQYLGFIGAFDDPNPANPIYSGWYPGYCKSTDNGVTWSPVTVVDFRTVLPNYDRLFDFIKNDAFVSYCGDINVDKDGYVHFILSVTDTTLNNNTGINSIIEIFETVSGWNSMIIYEGIDDNTFTAREGPAAGQMGPNGYIALDKDREHLACVWVADSPSSVQGLCDVYISWRNIYSNQWTTPINLTMTDNMNENGVHLAPQLYFDGGFSYKAFVGFFYELGNFGPNPNIINLTGFWVTNPTFTYTDVSDDKTALL
ncbi:MAG: hypothetical protein Q8M94_01820, partial [Ignavibacteria bacterium]|nr:hypothetical protein [Ignavibacteria bacterium]